MTVRLLAMAPSGEVYFTKDQYGAVWRHRPLGGHQPVEVNEPTVDWVVHRYDYTRVDEDFANFADAEAHVRNSVPAKVVSPDDLPVGPTVARADRIMRGWLDSPSDRRLIVATVNRLLADERVRADAQLTNDLLALSTEAARRGTGPVEEIVPILHTVGQRATVGGRAPLSTKRSRLGQTLAYYDDVVQAA